MCMRVLCEAEACEKGLNCDSMTQAPCRGRLALSVLDYLSLVSSTRITRSSSPIQPDTGLPRWYLTSYYLLQPDRIHFLLIKLRMSPRGIAGKVTMVAVTDATGCESGLQKFPRFVFNRLSADLSFLITEKRREKVVHAQDYAQTLLLLYC
jgi:hypothetical protein